MRETDQTGRTRATSRDDMDRLLVAVDTAHGYDFRNYSRASLNRRVDRFLRRNDFASIDDAIPVLVDDRQVFQSFVLDLTVVVTEMFRDPWVYRSIRRQVVPWLKTFPFVKIWHAGCATGEEVYAMAILLKEEGMTGRVQIYATDLNDAALAKAREGIYPVSCIRGYTQNYQKTGGTASFADYYHAKYSSAVMAHELRRNVVFANHNLVTDTVFGEMNMIMCRNVLIYFNRSLQDRVLQLFADSLCPGGLLCLGTKESLKFSSVSDRFEVLAKDEKLFKKRIGNGRTREQQ